MKIDKDYSFVRKHPSSLGYPLYQIKISLVPSVEEADAFSKFHLWELPLTVTVEGQSISLCNKKPRDTQPLTLRKLVNGGFGLLTSDPMEFVAAEKLVLEAIWLIKNLLVDLKDFREVN